MRYLPLQRTDTGFTLGKNHVVAGSRLELPNNPFGGTRMGVVVERDGALFIDFEGRLKALDDLVDELFGYAGQLPARPGSQRRD